MKRFLSLFLCLFLIVALADSNVFANPNISAETAVVIEAKTGKVLYDKGAYKEMYPASITKILTAIIAIESGNLQDMVTVSKKAANAIGSRVYLVEGERLSLEQLIYGLMVNSGNDAAIAIAEHISGSVEEFATLMNNRAKSIGARNSNFVNPHGLEDDNHYTSAYDIAVITQHALKNDFFRQVYSTRSYRWIAQGWDTTIINNHWIVNGQQPYEGSTGGKTGFTPISGHTLVTSAQRDGMEIIAVIMKSTRPTIYNETITLLNYGFNNFNLKKIVSKGDFIDGYSIDSQEEVIPLVSKDDLYAVISKNHDLSINREVTINIKEDSLVINKDEVVGKAIYKHDDTLLGTVDIISTQDIIFPQKEGKLSISNISFMSMPWWAYILVFYLIWRVRVAIRRRRRRAGFSLYNKRTRFNRRY